MFQWHTVVEATTRLFCIAVVAVQLIYLDILLLPMHTGYGHYEWILWLAADVVVLGTFLYSLLRLVRLLQWKQSRIRFQQQQQDRHVPPSADETEMVAVGAQHPLLRNTEPPITTSSSYVRQQQQQQQHVDAVTNTNGMLTNSVTEPDAVRPIFNVRTAGTTDFHNAVETSNNLQDLHDENRVDFAVHHRNTADDDVTTNNGGVDSGEPVLNGLRRRAAHGGVLAATPADDAGVSDVIASQSTAARGGSDVTDFPVVLFRQHLPNELPPPSAVLPVAYAAWLAYAIVMMVRLWVFFKRFARLLQVAGFFGTNMLKIMIGLSAAVYALLVSSHRRHTVTTTRTISNAPEGTTTSTTTTESRVDYYIRYMQKSVAFEILDSIQLLTILFIHESHMLLSFELESVILAFACMPLVLPVLPLLQMSSVRFVRRGVDYYPTEMFSVCYALLYTLLVNVPYLIIRVYLWNTYNYETELFIVKNIIGIVQSLWSALMALPVCSDACKRHKVLYWCCMHCCTKNSNREQHRDAADEAEIEHNHHDSRRIPNSTVNSVALTANGQPSAGVQPNILHIRYTPSPNPDVSLPPSSGLVRRGDLTKPNASELNRYHSRDSTINPAVDSINVFTEEDYYYNCQKAAEQGVGVLCDPRASVFLPGVLLSRAATVPSALQHTSPLPLTLQYDVDAVEPTTAQSGRDATSSSGVGHSFTSSNMPTTPQPHVNINTWSVPRALSCTDDPCSPDIMPPTHAGPNLLIEPHAVLAANRAYVSYPSSDVSNCKETEHNASCSSAEAGDSVAMLPKIVVRQPTLTRKTTGDPNGGGDDALGSYRKANHDHDLVGEDAAAPSKKIFFVHRQESDYHW